MTFEHASASHVGRRDNNEDAFLTVPERGLYAVADGMGGYAGGEVASAIVVSTLEASCAGPPELAGAILRAHEAVRARRQGTLADMGSTVAALVLGGGHAVIAHVGDSRVYRLRDGQLAQLTRDHSLAEELRAAGGEVSADFAYRNVITRAVGTPGNLRPDVLASSVEVGDVFLLCTDGLTEALDEAAIAAHLRARPAVAAPRLVEAAYRAGGRDNITAVVVRVRP
jgi:serine/threonine protein phosphatase PrpC